MTPKREFSITAKPAGGMWFILPAIMVAHALGMAGASPVQGAPVAPPPLGARPLPLTAVADPKITVPDVTAMAGKPARLVVTVPPELSVAGEDAGGPVFLMFRDLPPGVTLSAGFTVGTSHSSWAVALTDLPGLTLSSPPDTQGRFTIRVDLHRGKSSPPNSTTFTLALAPQAREAAPQAEARTQPKAQGAPAGGAARPTAFSATATPEATRQPALTKQEEDASFERAEALLKSGDFESARLIFTALAERGSRRAAFRLAQTYDPEVFASLFVVGLKPDVRKAREWYARAVELGAGEAEGRLNRLSTR